MELVKHFAAGRACSASRRASASHKMILNGELDAIKVNSLLLLLPRLRCNATPR